MDHATPAAAIRFKRGRPFPIRHEPSQNGLLRNQCSRRPAGPPPRRRRRGRRKCGRISRTGRSPASRRVRERNRKRWDVERRRASGGCSTGGTAKRLEREQAEDAPRRVRQVCSSVKPAPFGAVWPFPSGELPTIARLRKFVCLSRPNSTILRRPEASGKCGGSDSVACNPKCHYPRGI